MEPLKIPLGTLLFYLGAGVYIVPFPLGRGGGKCRIYLVGKKMQGFGKKIPNRRKNLRVKNEKMEEKEDKSTQND